MNKSDAPLLMFLAVIMGPGIISIITAVAGVRNPIDMALDTKVRESYARLEPKSSKVAQKPQRKKRRYHVKPVRKNYNQGNQNYGR